MEEQEGIWRTVGGRRIFIPNGKTLEQAMIESGKFNLKNKQKEETSNYKKLSKDEVSDLIDNQNIDGKSYNIINDDDTGFHGENAISINDCMRYPEIEIEKSQKKVIDALDKATSKNKIEENVIGTKYLTVDDIESQFNIDLNLKNRFSNTDAVMITKLLKDKANKDLKEPGFAFVDIDNKEQEDYKIKMNAYVEKGTNAFVENTGLLIMQRNTSYSIKDAYLTKDKDENFIVNIDVEYKKR